MVSADYSKYRSGIIPYFVEEDGEVIYMFMRPSDPNYGGSDWQMAKGRFDEGENDPKEVAIREGSEELGLRRDNILSVTEVGKFLGKTFVYICEVKSIEHFDPFHFETGDTVWLTRDEFIEYGRDIHQALVRAADFVARLQIAKREKEMGEA
jgi:8-oxo-dGTP pyrophosphatase MutT (NUDIX family)